MTGIKDNWYLVLGLEFDPNPVTDQAVINAKIEERKKYWSSHFNDMRHGAEYRRYVSQVKQIQEDMSDESKRKQMIADACDKTYKPIDTILKLSDAQEIPKDTIDAIAKKRKTTSEVVERRAKALGFSIGAAKHADAQIIFDQYYKNGPEHTDSYKQDKTNLESMHVRNLYQFLSSDSGMSEEDVRHSDCASLVLMARELKNNKYYKNDAISGTGQKLCAKCEIAFKNDAEKALYDAYLEYEDRRAILDEVRNLNEIGGMNAQTYKKFLDRLTESMRDATKAEKVLVSFCIVQKIPYYEDVQEDTNRTICRCGCINHVLPGQQGYCTNCGLPLLVQCPQCGKMNPNNVRACPKCGFQYGNLDKAQGACAQAEYSLQKMNFDAARFQLDSADQLWPGNERAAKIRQRLDQLQSQLGDISKQMVEACKDKKYYAAKALLDRIRNFSSAYKNEAVEIEINTAIEKAEGYKKEAETAVAEQDIITACTKAYDAAVDCPGIPQIMASHKPAAPIDVQVYANARNQVNVIAWKVGDENQAGEIYYVVRRWEGARPVNASDGDLVARVSGTSVNDTRIRPGVEYYYSVYAERAGVLSQNGTATNQPVVNLFEISHPKIAAGDASAALSWDQPADNATPEVVRTYRGESAVVPVSNRTGVLDQNLVNDDIYLYHICLAYHIGMQTMKTAGVDLTVTPTRPPRAIDHLAIKHSEAGVYQLTWDNPENAAVHFYYAQQRPKYVVNDLVAVSELERNMKELMVQKSGPNSGIFRYTEDATIYIMAVVIKSGAAVTGNIIRVSQGGAVRIQSVYRANGKIVIKTNEPKEYTGFVVLYRHDHFPEDLQDMEAGRKYFSKKQYEYSNCLTLEDDGKDSYFITVFAEFHHVGEDTEYSDGTDCTLMNTREKTTIFYEINVSKKLFGGISISITFSSDQKQFILPDIDVMSAIGAAPIFKHSAMLFESVPGEKITGTKTIQLHKKTVAKNTYIKPFLADEENNKDLYTLKLKGNMSSIS